jgi:hypothetical protein
MCFDSTMCEDAIARFWAMVDKDGRDGCWPWKGAKDKDGYGLFCTHYRQKRHRSHRLAYELQLAPVPSGYIVHHLCEHRDCVNPSHLAAIDPADHFRFHPDVSATGKNAAKTHCKNGHPFGEANTYLNPSGERKCRVCTRSLKRKYYYSRHPLSPSSRARIGLGP